MHIFTMRRTNGRRTKGFLALQLMAAATAWQALSSQASDAPNPPESPASSPKPEAVQTIYRTGVPHTTRRGERLTQYDAERSFFPIGSWGAPHPGNVYGYEYDWSILKQAGFNTVWPWPFEADAALDAAQKAGLQVILMNAQDEKVLAKIKDHPNLLSRARD